jgi:hypothetical protein
MERGHQKRRLPPPWRVEQAGSECYEIRDANGFLLASVHYRDDLQKWSFGHSHLTSDEARRIAAKARLPEFRKKEPAFATRRHQTSRVLLEVLASLSRRPDRRLLSDRPVSIVKIDSDWPRRDEEPQPGSHEFWTRRNFLRTIAMTERVMLHKSPRPVPARA